MTADDFLADLEADGVRPGTRCSVGIALGALGEPLAQQVAAALAGPYTHAAIGRQLRRRGVALDDQAISRHRKGDCACPR